MSENSEIQNKPPETCSVEVPLAGEMEIKPIETSIETKDATDPDQSDRNEILSKRAQKKILKMAKWEEQKKIKRQKEREKRKEKRVREIELGIIGPSSKRKKLKANKMENSSNLVSVAIDFDYDELMLDKDIAKCSKQMLRVYTENRKSTMPIRLHFTSIRENSRIHNSLNRNDGYTNWDVNIHQEPYHELFDQDRIVYLSSDSDHVLNELDQNAVYIIGGLVDHNHHKGLSLQRAEEKGFKTARLPLSEHIEMKTRSVLTIVHVFEILLKVSEGKPWKETLLEVLPIRKFRKGNKPHHKYGDRLKESENDDEILDEDENDNDNENENEVEVEPKSAANSNENSAS